MIKIVISILISVFGEKVSLRCRVKCAVHQRNAITVFFAREVRVCTLSLTDTIANSTTEQKREKTVLLQIFLLYDINRVMKNTSKIKFYDKP